MGRRFRDCWDDQRVRLRSTMKVYLDYTQEELDQQYEHRHFVADAEEYIALAKAESRRVRAAAIGMFDVPYGNRDDERIDVYRCLADDLAPVVIFFHGGRWSRGSKAGSCDAAEVFNAAGAHFISVNFSLLPVVTMDCLIQQCREAVAWIWRNWKAFSGDPNRLYVMGKSSGAHIGGMMVTTDWEARGLPADVIKGGLLISGMYDLEPVRLTFRNEWLKLDEQSARRNSPLHHIRRDGCPLVVGCGALETDEFRRQSREFALAWRSQGSRCEYMEVPDRHHYSVSAAMEKSVLLEQLLREMGLHHQTQKF